MLKKKILVLDVVDPLASSGDEVEMTTPGHPATTARAASTRNIVRSSRASSSGSSTTPSHHAGGTGIASSSLMAQIRQLKKAASSRLCAAFLIRPADKLCSCFASSAPVRLPRGDSIKGQWTKFFM